MTLQLSPLAHQVPGVRDPKLGTIRNPWGLLVHTTGGGITDIAKKKHEKPIDIAIKTYINSQNGSNGYFWGGPNYVVDLDGTLYQVAPDNLHMNHAGGQNRSSYIDGSWIMRCSVAAADQWRKKWGSKYKHPYSLFPSTSPNIDFVGIEMIPCGDGFGTPMAPGLRFSKAQHDAIVALAAEMGPRHGWPSGWQLTSRLLGHEDVDIINRHDVGGGWDAGFLREKPYFDFAYVRSNVG